MVSSKAKTVAVYLKELEPDRRATISNVREVVLEHLPTGYQELMLFGMICYVVPLARFPKTYNGQPLMYAALASQKNYCSLYLTNVYGDEATTKWFTGRYRASGKKLDMGKSCVRFRELDDLPVDLIGEAIARTCVEEFIEIYERSRPTSGSTRSGNSRG